MAQAILSNEAAMARTRGADSLNSSAISWPAVLAGAVAAAALSLILVLLGTGLGLSSVSPWAREGMDATSVGISTIAWITLTQVIAAGMGGYLAGRLRVKWPDLHADEVYFRDTAHGFLTWAVATLVTVTVLSAAVGSIINGGVQAGAKVAAGTAQAGALAMVGATETGSETSADKGQVAYFVDSLFRSGTSTHHTGSDSTQDHQPASSDTHSRVPAAEVTRIFAHAYSHESLPPEDVTYLGQLISRHTGMTQPEAEQRVKEVYAHMQSTAREAEASLKQAAEKARKASMYITLWLFVSLLMGAFSASLAATWGGRCRDA